MKIILLLLLLSCVATSNGQIREFTNTQPASRLLLSNVNKTDTIRVLMVVSDTSEISNRVTLTWSMYGYRVTNRYIMFSTPSTGRIYLPSEYLDNKKNPLPKGYAVFNTLDLTQQP